MKNRNVSRRGFRHGRHSDEDGDCRDRGRSRMRVRHHARLRARRWADSKGGHYNRKAGEYHYHRKKENEPKKDEERASDNDDDKAIQGEARSEGDET